MGRPKTEQFTYSLILLPNASSPWQCLHSPKDSDANEEGETMQSLLLLGVAILTMALIAKMIASEVCWPEEER